MIVDSSKLPTYAFILQDVPRVELHVVHLVRDSRATAFSWQRKKERPEIYWRTQYMSQLTPARTAVEWMAVNALFARRRLLGAATYSVLRYEDLVRDPAAHLTAISRQIDVPRSFDALFDDEGNALLGTDHTLAGNPSRFDTGAVKVVPDEEWRTKMTVQDKTVVTTASAPLLLRYRYVRPRAK